MDSGCSKHMTKDVENFLSLKELHGGDVSFENAKQVYILGIERIGQRVSSSGHGNLTIHNITVNTGEDVSMKVLLFSQQGSRSICILSATGVISRITFHQPDTSDDNLTFEGWYDILSFTGSFKHSETGGIRSLSGGMSVNSIKPR